jgi:hypothetical protein
MYSRRHSPAVIREADEKTTETSYLDRICSPGQHSASIKTISKRADKVFGRDATLLDVVPPAFGPSSSSINSFDPSDPVVRFELPRSELRDHFECLIGEPSDIQDVRTFGSLRGLVRLDVQAN